MRTRRVALLAALLSTCLVRCQAPAEEGDGAEDDFLVDGKADALGLEEGSAEACGVIRLVNEASVEVLDQDVRLDRRAATNIVAHRRGPDGLDGTADDDRFGSLGELDAVRWVGPRALERLLAHVEAEGRVCESVQIQILAISDWHGQLDPVAVYGAASVGGAATLAAYFEAERRANPETILLSAGDALGGSPPLASFFEERPVVEAMNLMGFDAAALGNHEFDRGTSHLAEMAEAARFPFLAANLSGAEQSLACPSLETGACVQPHASLWVSGVRVAVVGLLTPETPSVVRPGNLGDLVVGDPVEAARLARAAAAGQDAQVFVALAHLGLGTVAEDGTARGPLVDLAEGAPGFDLVVGGHTHLEYAGEWAGTVLVQSGTRAERYARVVLTYDFRERAVVERTVELVRAPVDGPSPDGRLEAMLAPYREGLAAAYDGFVGTATAVFPRGEGVERLTEVALGNLVADSLRTRYQVDLAFVNGGGLRSPLPSSYAPADRALRRPAEGYAAGPPFDLVVGDLYAVLPFNNATVTRTVTGAQIWQMVEHGLSALPAPAGIFGQVSGIRVTYDSTLPVGSRVTGLCFEDGSPVPEDGTSFTLATSDFLDAGGDGYAMLVGGDGVTRDMMADVLLEHVLALGELSPRVEGRIVDSSAQ